MRLSAWYMDSQRMKRVWLPSGALAAEVWVVDAYGTLRWCVFPAVTQPTPLFNAWEDPTGKATEGMLGDAMKLCDYILAGYLRPDGTWDEDMAKAIMQARKP